MKNEIVFALYKDKAIGSKKEFKEKIRDYIKDVNVSELFVRITNYQIDKYGRVLRCDIDDSYHDAKDLWKMCNNAGSRKRQRAHKYDYERRLKKWK